MSQLSYRQQTATGADINFTIDTFSSDELKVYVDGVLKTAGVHYNINPYNSNSQSTVDWIGTAPSNPSIVRIVRETDILNQGNTAVEGRATYAAGSSVKADDLNDNQKQVLRSLQEHNDQAIQTYDIEDKAVTRDKIALDAIDGTRLADDAVDSEHYVADSIDTEHYAPNSVDATAIGSNAVTTVKILDDNVTMDKLGSGALPTDITVNTDNIVNGSITTADIGANQITNALIADDQIDSEHYVDGSIDRAHLAADIIDSTKLDDNAVNSEHYVDGSIDRIHLEADIIDSTKLADDAVGSEHIQTNAVTDSEIATGTLDNRYYTETELNAGQLDNRYYTETELNAGQLDNRYYTETEAEARFLRQDSSETIASGVTWSASDAFVATTAAIDLRIIELVDNVGGFVPIDNQNSFPTENPDINNPATGGTIVSVQTATTALTAQSGTTLTLPNGRGTGNAVIITGVSATIPSGYGFLVETTSTDHTYAFHRLVPKATEVATVAANAVNISAAGANVVDINNFADLYQISTSAPTQRADTSSLQVGDLWFDSSSNKVLMIYDGSSGDGFTAATPNASDLVNINIVAGQITFVEDLGLITEAVSTGTGNQTLNTVAGIASNVTTVAGIASAVSTVAADGTDLGVVAGKETEIGRLGTAAAVADLAILGTTDVVADMNTLATADIVADMNLLATSDVIADMALLAVPAVITDMSMLATTDIINDMNTLANADVINDMNTLATTDIVNDMNTLATTDVVNDMNTLATSANVTAMDTCATNITNINTFANRYRIASSAPSTSLDQGDLYFDTAQNELKVYNGGAWQGGVTATGNLASVNASNTFAANQTITGNLTISGTVDGVDIATRDTLFGGLTSSSGVLTNGVAATTQAASDNTTKVATTAYVNTAVANLVDSAPGTLNTLNELAAALGDDANYATTTANSIATKAPLASPTFTGTVTAGTIDGTNLTLDFGTL